MPERCLYDTRFFAEYFYSDNPGLLRKLKEELRSTKGRMVSVITVHEMYRIDQKRKGREVAALRSSMLRGDFQVVDVDYDVAVRSAELRGSHQMPMADSMIAATAQVHDCDLFTDDAHFKQIPRLKTRWCPTC